MDNRTKTITAAVIALTMAASYTVPAGTGNVNLGFGNAVVASAADAGSVNANWQQFTAVYTVEDLKKINDNLSGNYVLMNDIDLKGEEIVIGTDESPFTGNFSGDGHTISGVNLSDECAGLFYKNSGKIMILAVKGNVTAEKTAGGICIINYGTIYGCSFEGTVTAGILAGGICGNNLDKGTINSCYAIATITSTSTSDGVIGGIAGRTGYLSPDKQTPAGNTEIESCYFAGTVTPKGNYAGPIIGITGMGGLIQYCYYDSDLNNETTSYGIGVTTEELCNQTLEPSNAFEKGLYSQPTPDPQNNRMGTIEYSYPRLKEGCEAHVFYVKEYNFSIDSTPDWQKFTEVRTADDLKKINENLSGNYVLMNDIDLKGEDIVIGTENSPFTGKFSGDGHTISGVKLDKNTKNIGLFGAVDGGLIMNLAVEGDVKGNNDVGIICGYLNGGKIINCYAIGSVEANDLAGGICGRSDSSDVMNCYFSGTVKVDENNNNKDAICVSSGNVENCYYNSDLYTGNGNGKGMSTFELTSSDALTAMGFTDSVWNKITNTPTNEKGKNGKAYFPSFKSSEYASSVGFSADTTFERTDDKALAFLDAFEVKYGVNIAFANGGSTALADGTNCSFTVLLDGVPISVSLDPKTDTFETAVQKIGKSTYSLECTPTGAAESFLSTAELTKSFTINTAKKALTASDFEVTMPSNLTYDGNPKTATVTVDTNSLLNTLGGYGDITVKYYDSNGKQVEQPINAGDYIVKIDVSGGENCNAVKDLTADTWKFTIAPSATPPTATDDSIYVSWGASGKKTLSVRGLPADLGNVNVTASISGDGVGVVQNADYSDGKVILTMGKNTKDDVGKSDEITFSITSPNFEGTLIYKLTVTLCDKSDQTAPDANDVRLMLTSTESGITAKIATALKGVEYSFDGVKWSKSNTASVNCCSNITGYIRFAETEDSNASPEISVSARSGHAVLVHHDADGSVCIQGTISEYWECSNCGKYFTDANGTSELALLVHHTVDPSAKWESDNDENHYHICTICHAKAYITEHTFDDGVVTLEPTETEVGEKLFTCTVCGYEKREVIEMTKHVHSVSDELYSDETGHWKSCLSCGEKIDFEEHTSDNGTVEGQAKVFRCTVCGYEISRAYNPNQNEGYRPTHFNEVSFSDIFSAPMPQFSEKLKAKSEVNGSTAVISWDKVEDAEKYVIYQLIDGKYKKIMTTKDTSVSIDKLKNGQTYNFMVRYIKNGELSPVTYSSKITVNIYYKPIVTAKASGNSVSLSWKTVPGAEKYAVYKYAGGKAVKLAEVKSTSVKIDGLKPDTEYSCIVSAFVDGKWTVMTRSDIVTVTTNK